MFIYTLSVFRLSWKDIAKKLVQCEQAILEDKSLEKDVIRTLVTYLRSPTLVSDLLETNSSAALQLKQAVVDLRKDYVVATIGM